MQEWGLMERARGIGGCFPGQRIQPPWAAGTKNTWDSILHLQITRNSGGYKARGPTAFAPLPTETEYCGTAQNQWMITFRVRRLDAIVVQLRAVGINR